MKKLLIVASIVLLTIGISVVPAYAYTVLRSTVADLECATYINASGSITGNTLAFSVGIVAQGATTTYTSLEFPTNPSGKTDSEKALKITGGTNVVGGRIIIATENDTLFTTASQDPRKKDVNVNGTIDANEYSGSDGSGLIGSSNQGYVASLYWGISTTPNVNTADYVFNYTSGSINWSWIVDKWHCKTYVPTTDGISPKTGYTGLDTANMYKLGAGSGAQETNGATEGTGTYKYLYPAYWDQDLYDAPSGSTRKVYAIGTDVVGEALYKNIGTIAYNIQVGSVIGITDYSGYYICQVPKWNTAPPNNYTIAKLMKTSGTTGHEYIYIPVGGDFSGLPAQSYSTTKLYVAMVQD